MRAILTLADREEISRGLAEGLEYKQIGVLIGRNPSVVSREVARHGGRAGYRAAAADAAAAVARCRPKTWAVERAPGRAYAQVTSRAVQMRHCPPEAGAQVRILPGAPGLTSTKRPLTRQNPVRGLSHVSGRVRPLAVHGGCLCHMRAKVRHGVSRGRAPSRCAAGELRRRGPRR
ncbi:helix-turn-helix domain-containing protein [Micromonospora sp. NPDC047548]|uniref:helix-turn-helix domain-containing protein n=1 Tax=Micromonospora sp. NPDC047548 TaxID=3155624 RepID=UPI0033E2542F